jgi:hypothetical protein
LDRLSSAEIALWQAEYCIEPWGDFRQDIQAAIVAQTMARFWGKHPGALRDYMIPFGKLDTEQISESQKFKQFCQMRGMLKKDQQ